MPQVAFAGWTETQRATDIARQWLQIASSKDGVYVLAGMNNGGSFYVSTDSGVTWTSRSPTTGNWQALAVSDTGQNQVAAPKYGQYLLLSSDYGTTWVDRTNAGSNRPWQVRQE